MAEKPYERLLHREVQRELARQFYASQFELLRDVVNYGTNLIPSCISSSQRELTDIIAISVLFKQVVLMLDGFEILTSNACTHAAKLQVRAMLEASLYLDWLLARDSERRAHYYYIGNLRKELEWSKRLTPGTAEQEAFCSDLGEMGNAISSAIHKFKESGPERIRQLEEFLSLKRNATVCDAFETMRRKKRHEVAWHVPLGAPNLRAIAKEVGRLYEHAILYSQFSEASHVSRHGAHITIDKGRITFEPIRSLDGLSALMKFAIGIAFDSYRTILKRYRPEQLEEYNRRYARDWREPFQHMTDVQVQTETRPNDFI